jgi:hypothetical protein
MLFFVTAMEIGGNRSKEKNLLLVTIELITCIDKRISVLFAGKEIKFKQPTCCVVKNDNDNLSTIVSVFRND